MRFHFDTDDDAAGLPLLAEPAERAKAAYDQHLRAQYDAFLASQQSEIRQLFNGCIV